MKRSTDVLPTFRPGMVLTAAHLATIAADVNARAWDAVLADVRADARAQVDALALRLGLTP